MKKAYLLVILFLCGLSVGNLFASASAAAAAATADEILEQALNDAVERDDEQEVARLLALASAEAEGDKAVAPTSPTWGSWFRSLSARAAAAASSAAAAAVNYLGQELINAAQEGNEKEVQSLLDKGAYVNGVDASGNTALILADNPAIAKQLLDAGADVNATNRHGYTALMGATHYGHEDIVKTMLDAGADVNAANQNGWTPLMYAADSGRENTVKLLLKAGANVNASNYFGGDTPLTLAAAKSHRAVVERLLPYASNRAKAIREARERGFTNLAKMIEDFGSGRLIKATQQPDVAPLPPFEAAVAEANLSDRQVQMLELYNLLMQDDENYDEEKALALYKELGRPQIKRAKGRAYKRVIQLRRRAYIDRHKAR